MFGVVRKSSCGESQSSVREELSGSSLDNIVTETGGGSGSSGPGHRNPNHSHRHSLSGPGAGTGAGPSGDFDIDSHDNLESDAMEDMIAEDAVWKRIQQNTFTRWANEHLKTVHSSILDLETDLEDGLRLIALLQVLSGKHLPKHNKKPNFRSQKLENVSLALSFLEKDEGIKLVNIDSSDIVDCKLKLILGLIWHLILHYSISMPVWDGEDEVTDGGTKDKGPTPKQRLLNWVQNKVPELGIANFTSDWKDGKAVGALVDSVAPGLCPDWQDWNPKDALENATEAMSLADEWLDVKQLIKPEEIVNPNIDELSMMTYLSQYPNAKLKSGAPLREKTNPSRVRCYGPGIEPSGPVVQTPVSFTVETFSAGQGDVQVVLENPKGHHEKVDVTYNNDRNMTYSCKYIPNMEGAYKVLVFYGQQGHMVQIPRSPFIVSVEAKSGDPSKVECFGPGIEPHGLLVGKQTYFDINVKDAGKGTPEVAVLNPNGESTAVPVKLRQISQDIWRCEYTTNFLGLHSVNVFFNREHVPKSPFPVTISPVCDARKVKASGRGLQQKGVRVGDKDVSFKIYTEGAGEGIPEVKIIGPGGSSYPVELKKLDESIYHAKYEATKEGRYVIMITYGAQEIPNSPFQIGVGPKRSTGVKVFGPGLTTGIVNHPASFIVETHGHTGALGFQIEGPSQSEIQCDDNGDGSANVSYIPGVAGEYFIHILCDDEDIENSPYVATILPKSDFNPNLVECSGPGLVSQNLPLNEVAEFNIDTRKAGSAPLCVQVNDAQSNEVPISIKKNSDGTHKCTYIPKKPGKHFLQVCYGGVGTKDGPYRINVVQPPNPKGIYVGGPGVENAIICGRPTHFNIDAKAGGSGEVGLSITDSKGNSIPYTVQDNGDDTFSVDYTPVTTRQTSVRVLYDNVEVPNSPFHVEVLPHVDVNKIQIQGLEPGVFLDSPTEFAVSGVEDSSKLVCRITSPSKTKSDSVVTPVGNGLCKVLYTAVEEGDHTINVSYDGLQVPGAPFPVKVQRGSDPSKVKAFGPGLEKAYVNQPNKFQIETKGAGTSGLGLAIEGPSEAKMTCKDNRDGSCTVEYIPEVLGTYDIGIKFGDKDIPGSPFRVPVVHSHSTSKNNVKAYGDGLDPKKVRAGITQSFIIDASQAGPAPMSCEIQGLKEKAKVLDNGDGTFTVTYLPTEAQANLVANLKYNGKDIENTPVHLKVRPKVEPDKVKLRGEGINSKTLPASLATSFEIDTSDAGVGDLDVEVLGPDNNKKKVKVHSETPNKFTAVYTPDDIGAYKVDVKYGGKSVGTPMKVNAIPVGNATKCKITEGRQEHVQAGQEQCITVNCKDGGIGAVTCKIKSASTGKYVDVETEKNEDKTYSVYFNAKEVGDYDVNIQYGGQPVPNGKYKFKAENLSQHQLKEEKLYGETAAEETYIRRTTTTRTTHQTFSSTDFGGGDYQKDEIGLRPVELYHISVPGFDNSLVAEVKMPTGNVEKPHIEENGDGTVNVKYSPKVEGLHEMSIKYNGYAIQGSPFSFYVDSISKGPVTAYGPGLTHGVSGEPCNFTISTKGATAAGLQLAVEGPSKADITCHDNKNGTVSVSFLPTAPGEYKVSVKYADKHLKGSPYTTKVTGEGRKRNQISVGTCSEVTFPGKVPDDLRSLNAFISAPSGLTEPCFLKKLPNGNIGISFTPRETGDHEVSVRKSGVHIANSPFKIQVAEAEVGDAGKVLVSGLALKEGKTHVDNTFNVVTKNAGYGGLSLSIEGPSKAEISCKDKPDGSLDISYKPTEPGYYIINLKFADHHVTGSPYTVKVTGEGSNRQRERIQRQRDAVPVTQVGSDCRLTFKMPSVTAYELSATVTSPSGLVEDAAIIDAEDGYAVHFVPKELGVHTISIKLHDLHIPGSPFSFTVGPLRDGGAHRVHAGGPGLEKGEQGVPCEFNVWTREAGAGSLAISVEGPSKAEIDFKDRKDGSCYVSYVVSEPGDYRVGIRFNEDEIPDSPFKVYVSPDTGEAKKVDIGQFPEGIIQTNKPATFLVRKNGAKGQLDAKLVSPSGHQDDCFIDTVDFDNYTVRFMPKENGINNIHIKFNGVHIPGSPYRVKVGKDDADPACVHAHGPGLQDVKSGQKTDFLIDTCNAGAGHLSVTVDGPSKVAMDCAEVEEGYKVHYTPLCSGNYYIGIRYNGYHIVGSPFKVTCSGKEVADKGDHESSSVVVETVHKIAKHRASAGPLLPTFKSNAAKVTSKGMGLKKAYLGKQNQFTVNASEAGNNILYVGLHGPKGPCEEVYVKHIGHHNYQVNYLCKDRGEYMIMVKWGDDHIPGSPFHVEI